MGKRTRFVFVSDGEAMGGGMNGMQLARRLGRSGADGAAFVAMKTGCMPRSAVPEKRCIELIEEDRDERWRRWLCQESESGSVQRR